MRFLKLGVDGELQFSEDFISELPSYAILSHTWGVDEDEITFDDINNGSGKGKSGYVKIKYCGRIARKHGLIYFWVDTCCIDKRNSVELQEAITSMYRWYRDAARCYMYLSDVSTHDLMIGNLDDDSPTDQPWKSAFRKSRYFQRGWTLQEMLAPSCKSIVFFSCEMNLLGDRKQLAQLIHEITSIPVAALHGESLHQFSVEEKMRWSKGRQTKRVEDKAYCLLGLFGISMRISYGEGDQAFVRLESKIKKISEEKAKEVENHSRLRFLWSLFRGFSTAVASISILVLAGLDGEFLPADKGGPPVTTIVILGAWECAFALCGYIALWTRWPDWSFWSLVHIYGLLVLMYLLPPHLSWDNRYFVLILLVPTFIMTYIYEIYQPHTPEMYFY